MPRSPAPKERRAPPTQPAPPPSPRKNLQVAGIVGLICAGLYPTVVVPLQIAYAGREHPAQKRLREEAEQRQQAEQQQQEKADRAAAANNNNGKPQAGFARKSMWASINQAAKSAKS